MVRPCAHGSSEDLNQAQEGEQLRDISAEGKLEAAEVTPMVHLYRGEINRLTAYRMRLDSTTTWAVSTTAALVAFALGNNQSPDFFFLFIFVLQVRRSACLNRT